MKDKETLEELFPMLTVTPVGYTPKLYVVLFRNMTREDLTLERDKYKEEIKKFIDEEDKINEFTEKKKLKKQRLIQEQNHT